MSLVEVSEDVEALDDAEMSPMLLQLANGSAIWAEIPMRLPPVLSLDARRTVRLIPRGNEAALSKVSDEPGRPRSLLIPRSSILQASDCRDEEINRKARAALAGLILAN